MADNVEPRSMVEAHFPSGTVLGPYVLQSLVGAGGMGEVYRAHDSRLGRDVAVKVLSSAVGLDPERVRRFDVEARATAALSHPNILAVYDSGWHEGAPFLVTELLEGEDLGRRNAGGTVTIREAVDIRDPDGARAVVRSRSRRRASGSETRQSLLDPWRPPQNPRFRPCPDDIPRSKWSLTL